MSAKLIMAKLATDVPELYGAQTQLRTLLRKLKKWRYERAKKLIYGDAAVEPAGHSTVAPLGGHCGVKPSQVGYNFTSNISL